MTAKKTTLGALSVLLLGALAAAGCGGKGTEGTCATFPACGGNPQGNWTLATGCLNLVNTPYQQPSLPDQLAQPQTITEAPPQPQPTTSGDWCSQLVYEPTISPTMPVRGVVLWHSPPTVNDGFLRLNADHTYDAHVRYVTHEHTYFANACLTRYDVVQSCEQFGMDLAAYEHSQPGFMFGITDGAGNTDTSMVCKGDVTVGCDCYYDYQGQSGEMGTWNTSGNGTSIWFSSVGMTEPQSAGFCQTNGSLDLTGDDGTSLFGAQGLRTAHFVPTP
jgi:hypothetical protein